MHSFRKRSDVSPCSPPPHHPRTVRLPAPLPLIDNESVSGRLAGQSYLLSSPYLFISQQEGEGEARRSHRKQPVARSAVAS